MSSKVGGWETWQWDETLFEGAAPFYLKGRLPYAPGLGDAIQNAIGLDGHGRLLDLGCGPGTVTLRLAHLFAEVVGLDADPGMLSEAVRSASELGIANANWVRMRAEDLPADIGRFRLITLAASFHWMDRPKVAATIKSMLDPRGAAMQVDAPAYRPPEGEADSGTLPYPPPPLELIEQLRQRYLGPDRRAGRTIRNTSPSGEDKIFQDAGFEAAETVAVPDGRVWDRTSDDIVANVFSSSQTVPGLFGNRLAQFEAELRTLLAQASPSGLFSVILPDNILRIWRPAPASHAISPMETDA